MKHAIFEELLRPLLASFETIRSCHQLFCFGHKHRAEELWIRVLDRPAEPNVEEIREICIPNIVVIRGVRAHHNAMHAVIGLGIKLSSDAFRNRSEEKLQNTRDPIKHVIERA